MKNNIEKCEMEEKQAVKTAFEDYTMYVRTLRRIYLILKKNLNRRQKRYFLRLHYVRTYATQDLSNLKKKLHSTSMHYCTLRVSVYSFQGVLIESHPPPRCYAHLLVLRTSSVINVYSLDFKIFKFFSPELLYSTRKCVQFVGGVDRIPPTTQVLRSFNGASQHFLDGIIVPYT